MKYIDAEKLKKTVGQAKQRALNGVEVDEDMYCYGRANAFGEVLLEIDLLQQEQQKCLEEAAEKYADSMGLRGFDKVRTKIYFKAGAEWKEQQEVDLEEELEKPMNQDELEKEYQEFCKDYPFPWSSQYVNREYIDELCLSIARYFAQWGAEHLKK